MNVTAKIEGQYMNVACECGARTRNTLHWDGGVPAFTAKCEKCKREIMVKLHPECWPEFPARK